MKSNIRAERARLHMSAKEVASAIGVHENTVIRWESGAATPRLRNIYRLSELYDCTPDYLLGYTDDRHRNVVGI